MFRSAVKLVVGAVLVLALGGGLLVGSAAASDLPPSVFTPPPGPPRNDQFVNAITLSPTPTPFSISPIAGAIRYASAERGEPQYIVPFGPVPANHSVWYSWTAPRNGLAEFDTCNSHFDTLLGVYRGSSVAALTTVVQDDDDDVRPGPNNKCGTTFPAFFNSQVEFQAVAGTTYRIAIDGYFGGAFDNTGSFFLNYRYL